MADVQMPAGDRLLIAVDEIVEQGETPERLEAFFQALGSFAVEHFSGSVSLSTDIDGTVTAIFTPAFVEG